MIAPAILFLLAGAVGQPPASACSGEAAGGPDCAAAIASASDSGAKAVLLADRAYAFNEQQRFDDALRDLDQAVVLDPANAAAAHERGFTLNALGRYADAIPELERALALRSGEADIYVERAFSRHHLADLAGEYADRDKVVELRKGDPNALLSRSDAALWLGRLDAAAADATEGRRLAAGNAEVEQAASRQLAEIELWRRRSAAPSPATACRTAAEKSDFTAAGLFGDCSAAFLAADKAADKAEYLSYRSMVRLVALQDQDRSTSDTQMAAALDPSDPKWHSNLGYAYLRVRHSRAAVEEFDRALSSGEMWVALAGRAAARMNLGDVDRALADATRSVALRPNEAALLVLGDIAHQRNDDAGARNYWLRAFRTDGGGGGDAAERLRSIGVEPPGSEAEKK